MRLRSHGRSQAKLLGRLECLRPSLFACVQDYVEPPERSEAWMHIGLLRWVQVPNAPANAASGGKAVRTVTFQ